MTEAPESGPTPRAPQANPELLGHEAAEATLLRAFRSGRLPHAWLTRYSWAPQRRASENVIQWIHDAEVNAQNYAHRIITAAIRSQWRRNRQTRQ